MEFLLYIYTILDRERLQTGPRIGPTAGYYRRETTGTGVGLTAWESVSPPTHILNNVTQSDSRLEAPSLSPVMAFCGDQ